MADKPGAAAVDDDQPKTWKERFFGKKFKRAHLGIEENKMYYSKELGCWVVPGEEDDVRQKKQELSAPPPKVASAVSMASSADASTASVSAPPSMGSFSIPRSSVSRYATAPGLKSTAAAAESGGPQASASSVFAGLRPPTGPAFAVGASSTGTAMFKPPAAAVFKPAAATSQESVDSATMNSKSPRQHAGSAAVSPSRGSTASTPRGGKRSAAASPRVQPQAALAGAFPRGESGSAGGGAFYSQSQQQQVPAGAELGSDRFEAPVPTAETAGPTQASAAALSNTLGAEVGASALQREDSLDVGAIQSGWDAGQQGELPQGQQTENGGHSGEQYSSYAGQYSEQYYGQDGQYAGYTEQVVQATGVDYEGGMQYMVTSTTVVEGGSFPETTAAANDESYRDSTAARSPSTFHHDSFVQPHPSEGAVLRADTSNLNSSIPGHLQLEGNAGGDIESSITLLASDPVFREVLGFWAYYRHQCGYDADALQEWVCQHYYDDYTNLDYDALLEHPSISQLAQEHIAANTKAEYGAAYATEGGAAGQGDQCWQQQQQQHYQEQATGEMPDAPPQKEGSWEHVQHPEGVDAVAHPAAELPPSPQSTGKASLPGSRHPSLPPSRALSPRHLPPPPPGATPGSKIGSRGPSLPGSPSYGVQRPAAAAEEDPTLGQVFQSFLRPQVAQLAQRVTAAASAAQHHLHSMAQHGQEGEKASADSGVASPSAQQAQQRGLGQFVALGQSMLHRADVAGAFSELLPGGAARKRKAGKLQKPMPWDQADPLDTHEGISHADTLTQQAQGMQSHAGAAAGVSGPSDDQQLLPHSEQQGEGMSYEYPTAHKAQQGEQESGQHLAAEGSAPAEGYSPVKGGIPGYEESEECMEDHDLFSPGRMAAELGIEAESVARRRFLMGGSDVETLSTEAHENWSDEEEIRGQTSQDMSTASSPGGPLKDEGPAENGHHRDQDARDNGGGGWEPMLSDEGQGEGTVGQENGRFGNLAYDGSAAEAGEGWDDDEPFEPLDAMPLKQSEPEDGHQAGQKTSDAQQAQHDEGSAAQGPPDREADGWGGEEFGEGWGEGFTSAWTEEAGQAPAANAKLPQHAQQGLPSAAPAVIEEAAAGKAPRAPRVLLHDLDAAAAATAGAAGSRPSSGLGGGLHGEGPLPSSGPPSTACGEGLLAQLQQQLDSLTKAYQQQQQELETLKEESEVKDSQVAQMQDGESSRAARQLLADQLAEAQALNAALEIERDDLLSSVREREGGLQGLQQAKEDLEEQLRSLDAKCEGMAELLAEKAKALEEGSSQQEVATSQLKEQLEATMEELRAKAGELEDALLQIEMKEESLQYLQTAAKRADELDARLAERDAELVLAEQRLQDSEVALEAAQQDAQERVQGALMDVKAKVQASVQEVLLQKDAELRELEAKLTQQLTEQAEQAQHEMQATVAEREGEIERLNGRVKELEKKFVVAKKKIQMLQHGQPGAATKDAEVQSLTKQLEAAQQQLAAASQAGESRSADAAAELAALREQLAQQAERLEAQQAAAADALSMLTVREAEVEALKAQLAEAATGDPADSARAAELAAEVEMLKEQLGAAHKEDAALTEQLAAEVASLQSQLAEVTQAESSRVLQMAQDMADLQEQLARQGEQLEEQQQAAADALTVLAEREEKVRFLEQQLEEAIQQGAFHGGAHDAELATLQEQLAQQGERLEAQQEAAADALAVLTEREEELGSIKAQLADAKAATERQQAMDREVSVLRQHLQEVQAQLAETLEQLEQQEEQLEEAANADAAAAAEKDSQIEALAAQLQQAQQQLDEAEEELHQRQAELQQAGAAGEALAAERDAEIAALTDQLLDAQQQAAAAAEASTSRLAELSKVVEALHQQLASSQEAQAALSEEQHAAELGDLREQLEEQQAAAADALAVLAQREAEVETLKAQLAEAGNAADAAQAAEVAALREQLAEAQDTVASLSGEMEALTNKLEGLVESHAKTLEDLDAENLKLMDMLEAKQEDLEMATVEIAELRSRLERAGDGQGLGQENERLQHQLTAAQAALAAARSQLDSLDSSKEERLLEEIDSLRHQLAAALEPDAGSAHTAAEVEALREQLEAAEARAAEREAHAEQSLAQQAQLASKLEELEEHLEAQQAAAADALAVLSEREAEVEALKAQLAEAATGDAADSARAAELAAELGAVKEQLAAAVSAESEEAQSHAWRVQELEASLGALQENVTLLETAVQDRDLQLFEMQQQLAAAVAEGSPGYDSQHDAELAALQEQLAQQAERLEAQQEAAADALAVLTEREAELVALKAQLAEAKEAASLSTAELATARQRQAAYDGAGAPEGLMEELASQGAMVAALQAEMASLQQAAQQREEDLRKFKLQLVKAKKLRQQDSERIAALEREKVSLQEALSHSTAGQPPAPSNADNDEAVAEALALAEAAEAQLAQRTQHADMLEAQLAEVNSRLQALSQQVAELQESNADNEESLADCLTSLGQEEAKVDKLIELLTERGMDELSVQSVLQQVEEEAGWGDSDDNSADDLT